MEQNIIIYIGIWKFLTLMAGIVAGTWYAAYRLGRVETNMVTIEANLSNLTGRVDKLYEGQSRVALLPKGVKILEESGLKQWIDDNASDLLAHCKTVMNNPYDIQTAAFALFERVNFSSELEAKLKTAAFQSGVNMDNVRRIGGIYFRDICLKKAGFDPDDLDKTQ